jgi:preprotein translocase subunit SecF
MIAIVTGSGAVGGLIAWVLQASTGGRLLPFPWYESLPAALLLGGAAAGIGVYVLANTNLKQAGRAVFFAVLCGIGFRPVFQAGSDFLSGTLSQAKAQSQSSDLQQSTQQLSQALTAQPPQEVQAAVQKTGEMTASLVQQSAAVPDEALKAELQANSAKAVDTIAAAAPKALGSSVQSLYQIGLAAKKTNQTNLTLHVLDSLQTIEASSSDQATKTMARDYASRIKTSKVGPIN